jgi:cobalamin biosynthesis Mg chelatase CobN
VLDQMASGGAGGADSGAVQELIEPAESAAGEERTEGDTAAEAFASDGGAGASPVVAARSTPGARDESGAGAGQDTDAEGVPASSSEGRSPWPMVLFVGVAVMVGAAGLRWILVPRAG